MGGEERLIKEFREGLVISDCLLNFQQFIVDLVIKEERENWGIWIIWFVRRKLNIECKIN